MRGFAAFLTAIMFVGSPALAGQAQWGMFKNGMDRTGRTSAVGPQTGNIAWQHLLHGFGIQAPPAIAHDGTIYAGSVHGIFYAFRPTGSIKWKIKLSQYEITSSPAVAPDGTIYVSAENGDLNAFDPHGTLKWTFDLDGNGGPSASPALGPDGAIYVGANRLYAVNPDGSPRWNYDTGFYISGPPAIGDDGAVYFTSNNYLFALNADGSLRWRADGAASYPPGSSPAIGKKGRIYVNTYDGTLLAYRANGTLAWKYGTPGIVMDVPSSPAIARDGTIYFGGAGEYQGKGGYFYAINPDGSLKWQFFAGCDQTAPSIGGDGTIYFGSDYCGAVHALNPDGTQKWVREMIFDYMRSTPAIGRNGLMVMGTLAGPTTPDQGGLVAFGP